MTFAHMKRIGILSKLALAQYFDGNHMPTNLGGLRVRCLLFSKEVFLIPGGILEQPWKLKTNQQTRITIETMKPCLGNIPDQLNQNLED